ncbi:MAG: SpoIIE family protein phosphatase [Candidatus Eisenbacteria bacterium]
MKSKRRPIVSLQVIFAVSVGVLLSALTLATGWIIVEREKGVLESEVRARLLAQGRSLASLSASPLLDQFPEFVLHPLITDILEENRELAYAVVVDRNGMIRGDRIQRNVDQPYQDRETLEDLPIILARRGEEEFRHDEEVLEVSVPILFRDGSVLGRVHLGMEKDHLRRTVRDARRSTLRVVGGALLAGLIFTVFLVSRIVKPINQLTKGTEEIGRGNLDYRIAVKSVTEVGRLADTFNEMAGRLKEAQRDLVEKERLGVELEIAREIEEKMLPRPNLALPGYDVAGYHQPAQAVGGDYYDLIPLDDEHVGVTVADVAGKGVPGLVVMAMTSALLRTHGPRYKSPAEMLVHLNDMLYPNMKRGMFITMFYGVLHLPSGRFVFASAGHNPLLPIREGGVLGEPIGTRGIPLGLFSDGRFAERIENAVLELGEGEGFVQYTDGVSEATNGNLEEFGDEGLRRILREHGGNSSRWISDAVVEGVRRFVGTRPPSDDLTLLVVKRTAAVRAAAARGAGA